MKDKILSLITKNKTRLIIAAVFLVFGILLGRKLSSSKSWANEVDTDTATHIEEDGHDHNDHSTDENTPKSLSPQCNL